MSHPTMNMELQFHFGYDDDNKTRQFMLSGKKDG
ncbi:hypothetical protein J2Z65_006397 [Paenibacillus aceris]|uniref:Uncharacterized protein n=1 Tax=Paenibacillus aceris TaxID=869555 RepID=A0ABS4I8F3_9BACL|nr:hypothetical protein [Paenibacillus aceris]